ncbi:GNAT family N-acetyltransferase [Bacillus pumilus]|uniref:GNAT family N-acetyltransferase n=1 Tax=Bacillus pumilus TaxID=1408 RepID=UPI0016713386|nr:GNAT family N-acetyltransferase [Bacillus pumilus]
MEGTSGNISAEELKDIIRNWGIPKGLLSIKENIEFKFSDEGIKNNTETHYRIDAGTCKFCLYDVKEEKPLFSMEFYQISDRLAGLMAVGKPIEKPLVLEFLYVHDDSLRKKGIATFYMKKIIRYAKSIKVDYLKVKPNTNADNFKKDKKTNALSQEELLRFYTKFSTREMPVVLVNI